MTRHFRGFATLFLPTNPKIFAGDPKKPPFGGKI